MAITSENETPTQPMPVSIESVVQVETEATSDTTEIPVLLAVDPLPPELIDTDSPKAIEADEPSNPCANTECPMIACENSLPAAPEQGICCPRCVPSSVCNVNECPVLKCATNLVPANIEAGECCDTCAPETLPPIKAVTMHLSQTDNDTSVSSEVLFSASSETSDSSSLEFNSSSLEHFEENAGCGFHDLDAQSDRCRSRYTRLLNRLLYYLRRGQDDSDDESSVSTEIPDK